MGSCQSKNGKKINIICPFWLKIKFCLIDLNQNVVKSEWLCTPNMVSREKLSDNLIVSSVGQGAKIDIFGQLDHGQASVANLLINEIQCDIGVEK